MVMGGDKIGVWKGFVVVDGIWKSTGLKLHMIQGRMQRG
jgi:hypothetical protein